MVKVGVDPWVVHFYAFFLAVWGELTPPTSVVAAVTAKIADASFSGTLFSALQLCVVLFVLMAGIFSRPALVLKPGLAQLGAFALLLAATVGITFSIQAKYSRKKMRDVFIRVVLAGLSLVVLFHPSTLLATIAILPIGALVGYWFLQKRKKVSY